MFKLYTQDNCPNCENLKEFFKQNNVEFEELNIEKDFKARSIMVLNDLETTPAVSLNGNVFGGDLEEIKNKVAEML